MEDVQNILYEQKTLAEEINKIKVNFKKSSYERRTRESTKRRLETLERNWNEYKQNSLKLIQKLDLEHDYFKDKHYEATQRCYLEAKELLEREIKEIPKGENNPPPEENPETSRKGDEERGKEGNQSGKPSSGTNSKLDDMMKKQHSNFKAFARTVSNINIDKIQDRWEFEDSLKIIEARWKAIDTLHWELDSDLDGSNTQYDLKFTEQEQKYYDIKKAINSKLWSVSHREKSTPKLDIPIFNGNYQQWVSFKDLFCEAIHNNPTLSNAQKMQFLKSKLKGEAERLIQHLQISSENYTTSWDILNNRYNNKKLIFTTHMNTLMNISVIQQPNANQIKRLHDVTTECLNAVKNLGVNIDTWDPILVHVLVQKLDAETHSDYLESLKHPRELPILAEFLKFLENKFTTMETSRRKQEKFVHPLSSKQEKTYNYKHFSSNKAIAQSHSKGNIKLNCPICKSTEHGIYFCKQFLEMSPAQKRNTIAKLQFCFNCLYNHFGKPCTSNKKCRECNGSHNTILHEAFTRNNTTTAEVTSKLTPSNAESTQRSERTSGSTHVAQQRETPEILLATALLQVQAVDGSYHTMRALIDSGSQVSLITTRAAQVLRIPRRKCRGIITGVGTKDNTCTGMININCISITENYTFNTDVYIMKSLTRDLPSDSFQVPSWDFLEGINLADPEFNNSKPVDILFGAEVYSYIIMNGIRKASNKTPIAQQTRLGWILCGKIETLQCNVILNNMNEIRKFWEIEDISDNAPYSTEENECVDFYKSTTTRLEDGRYQVRLPLNLNIEKLGLSKNKAIAQFRQLERKFDKNSEIKKEYKSFIHEYQELRHMKLVNAHESNSNPVCYLPHHCVLREDSLTTSHRVVFNASNQTSSGMSLNDCMYKGPNLQKDLLTLILSWRKYQVAFTADIEKMFRQIWVHEGDQSLQRIIWRDHPYERLQEYQLTTVTYGTKAAPFLAMMTLRQLANDEKKNYPEAAQVVESSFYMDDLLHGTHSLESAMQLKRDLLNLMKSGGFNLRKWNSNYQELLQDTDDQQQYNYDFKLAESTKTLGLYWNPNLDAFVFQSKINDNKSQNKQGTKRSLLSDISRLFDPLGWLTPLSTKLKLLFQRVWQTNMAWDDKLPEDINIEWQKIKVDIVNIIKIQIPRWYGSSDTCELELHGFCDASQKAYACVIYSKSKQKGIVLVAGKARLVPCNKQVSLPRLELCGALLLSELMEKVKKSLSPTQDIKVYGWIDSMAVLGWLQGDLKRWKPFVSNRVSKIINVMPSDCWRYVKSAENPADCASRGLTASQLQLHPLWWQGPAWLTTCKNIKQNQITYTTHEEEKIKHQVSVVVQNQESSLIQELVNKYSTLTKLVRVLAWVRRFVTKKENRERTAWLTLSELRKARILIIKQVQRDEFEEEVSDLKQKKIISTKSKLQNLNPVLDEDGILRVGGRLKNAYINPEMKNPIILPQNHRFTEMVVNNAHELTYHGGARVTLAFTRQKYWIMSGNRTTKRYLHKCVTCKKQKPIIQEQIMGNLPVSRVNPSRPFKHTGVDFTGHIYLKANKGRGIKTTKGYVAVFICMATKAVHLELVSDLTSSSFIAALRRMSARRGTPSDIYCDNGRNFVGANKVLQQEYQETLQVFNDQFQQEMADMEIKFHFNAPSWPSAGGLWEAAVKSFKYHLKRVVGEQKLTYEEYTTLLTQIEACLNSRPLCALTEDPDDVNYLTPSHFLTSGPMLTLVETEKDLRTRWQLTQRILGDIWKRWRAEYLSQLSSRSKWRDPKSNIKLNDVVLIHEENLPPGKWSMGRVVKLHPGSDGYVRVVTLKTRAGYLKRPVIKLSVLVNHEDVPMKAEDQVLESANKATSTRKIKKSFFTTMFMTFLLFMTIITGSNTDVNVTQFRKGQGLYFDKVSNMLLIKDEWKLVVYYQMEPYWQGNKALYSYSETLDKACKAMQVQSPCNAIVLQLRHGYEELEYYNRLLMSQQFGDRPARQRLRRGLINGIGYAANSLFGVLDERFAEQYKQDISLLQDNQKHITELWKNQTSVVESENNLLKRIENVMNQQHKVINQHMNTLERSIEELKNTAEVLSISNDFAIGAILASNVLNNLKSLQNTLLDTVTDVYHGRFNLHLLTPEQLIDELSTISSKLAKDVSLPVENIHSDLRQLYSLFKVKTRILKEYLFFEIRIPLISRETYEILKIIPVPKYQEDKTITLVPISDYIAMNIKKDTFIPMSEIDVKACMVQSEKHFCHSQKPEYQLKGDKNLCDTKNEECRTRINSCKNIWQDSYTINTYIYSCCEQCRVRTMCEDQMTAHQLSGAGLITIGHGCIIKTDEFTIYPHKPHTSEVRMSPNLYIPTIAPINHIINITIPHLNLTNQLHHEEFEQETSAIQNKIRKLKESQVLSESVSYHDVHHYIMIYVIFGVIITVGLVYGFKRLQCRAQKIQSSAEEWANEAISAPHATPKPERLRPAATTRDPQTRSASERAETNMHTTRNENKSTSPILRKYNFDPSE